MNAAIGPSLPLRIDKKNGFLMIEKYSEEIKQNLKILLLTAPGERVFDRGFGVGVRNFLFENFSSFQSQSALNSAIKKQISKYLPVIQIVNIDAFEDLEVSNLFRIKLVYEIPALNVSDELSLTIK